eukprot:1407251-Lingulodinium_polyedra.AAC.1
MAARAGRSSMKWCTRWPLRVSRTEGGTAQRFSSSSRAMYRRHARFGFARQSRSSRWKMAPPDSKTSVGSTTSW